MSNVLYLQEEELFVLEVRRAHEVVDVRLEVGLLVHAHHGSHVERAGAGAEVVLVVAAVVQRLLGRDGGFVTDLASHKINSTE